MVRCNNEHVSGADGFGECRQRGIKGLQRRRESRRIVPVPVQCIEVPEVHEDQSRIHGPRDPEEFFDACCVRPRVVRRRQSAQCEKVIDLADARRRDPRGLQQVEECRLRRNQREILTVRGPRERPRRPDERAGDDTSDLMTAHAHLRTRDLADLIQPRQRDHLFMRRDLEHGIRGGVHDRVAGAHMLGTQILDDHRP